MLKSSASKGAGIIALRRTPLLYVLGPRGDREAYWGLLRLIETMLMDGALTDRPQQPGNFGLRARVRVLANEVPVPP